MNLSRSIQISYGGKELQFDLLERCSVSDHLEASGSFYELSFLEALSEMMPHDVVAFDVGAHIGNHTVYFAGVLGWSVVAFEPNPVAFEKLVANVSNNALSDLVTCFPVALGAARGRVHLALTDPTDAGTATIIEGARGEMVIEAELKVLDDFLHLAEGRPVLTKLDVEGHEKAVIEGGSRFINRVRPVLTTEVQSLAAFDELAQTLHDHYRPCGLFNPTPTVLWAPEGHEVGSELQSDLVRYGIRAAIGYNRERQTELRRSRWLSDAQARVAAEDHGAGPGSRAEDRSQVARMLDQISGARAMDQARGKRVAIIAVGDCEVPAAALSIVLRAVDVVELGSGPCRTVAMKRYVGGDRIEETVVQRDRRLDDLTAASAALFVESGISTLGPLDLALTVGGESAPELTAAIIDLLHVPYLSIALEASYNPNQLRTLVGSSACYVSEYERLEKWIARQLLPGGTLDPSDAPALLKGISQAMSKPRSVFESDRADGDHRVLLVSYYSPPATTVSVHRLAYWMDHLSEISSSEFGVPLEVKFVTATRQSAGRSGYIVVPDRGPLFLPEHDWLRLRELEQHRLNTLGISWSHQVRQVVRTIDRPYQTVVISGNPFYYFDLAPFFKEIWGSRVILDFRDPFARNERFAYTVPQRTKLISLEDEYVAKADTVISVNEACLAAIAPNIEISKYVIANGYDDSIIDEVPATDWSAQLGTRATLAYAGTVFRTLPLDGLLSALDPGKFRVIHFGRDYSKSQATRNHPTGISRGLVPYKELISGLKGADAGLIVTGGESTTSTTKLFDYLACDLDVIIITQGVPRTGNLHELTADLDGIHWVVDNPAELRAFFNSYRPQRLRRPQRARFSRRNQARRLLELVFEPEMVS